MLPFDNIQPLGVNIFENLFLFSAVNVQHFVVSHLFIKSIKEKMLFWVGVVVTAG